MCPKVVDNRGRCTPSFCKSYDDVNRFFQLESNRTGYSPPLLHPLAPEPQKPDISAELEEVEDMFGSETGVQVVDKHRSPGFPFLLGEQVWRGQEAVRIRGLIIF